MTNVYFKVLLSRQHQHHRLNGFTVVLAKCSLLQGSETACGVVVEALSSCCVNRGHAVGYKGGRGSCRHAGEQSRISSGKLLNVAGMQTA